MIKKLCLGLFVLMLLLAFAACTDTTPPPIEPPPQTEQIRIGVSMPTQTLQRWNQDGSNIQRMLEAAGFAVELHYADNDSTIQAAQIAAMLCGGCEILIVAAVDSEPLHEMLAEAKEQGVTVISYDRLLLGSDAVSYYASFDNWQVGILQGKFIEEALALKSASGPFYIELFTGSPDDNNIHFFFGGAMQVLQPYLDSGVLVVGSAETSLEEAATMSWSSEESQNRMQRLIDEQGYGPAGAQLDAVLCSNDSVALGVIQALQACGYSAENFPLITGQDCDLENVKHMLAGRQNMSVFKDTRVLASLVVEMVNALVKGQEPPVNDTTTYDNGTGIIPSFLCEPVVCTLQNYERLLLDSGYYTQTELGLR